MRVLTSNTALTAKLSTQKIGIPNQSQINDLQRVSKILGQAGNLNGYSTTKDYYLQLKTVRQDASGSRSLSIKLKIIIDKSLAFQFE